MPRTFSKAELLRPGTMQQRCLALAGGGSFGALLTAGIARTSPMMGTGMMLGLVVFGAILISPELGLWLTASVIPIERLGRLTNDSSAYTISLMRIVGMFTLAAYLLHTALRRKRIVFGLPVVMYAAYLSYGLLTIFWTNDRLGGIRAGSAMLGNLLFLFLIVNVVRDWSTAKRVVMIWMGASLLIGVFTIYQWHSGSRGTEEIDLGSVSQRFSTMLKDNSEWESLNQVERALGPTSSPAVYAINMILTLPFFIFLFRIQTSVWRRLGIGASILIVLYNVLLTNTRAAILLAVVVVLMCVVRGVVQLTPPLIGSGVVLLGIVLAITPAAVYHRVLDVSNYSAEKSGTLRARLAYWQAGTDIASEYWYKGIGIGNQAMVPKYANIPGPEFSSVHNEYLNTFLEVGLFGWIFFFGFIGVLLHACSRAANWYRSSSEAQEEYWFLIACQIAMISVLLFAVQVDVFHFPLKGWWLVASVTVVMDQIASKARTRREAQ
jgi:O-antigen ligase